MNLLISSSPSILHYKTLNHVPLFIDFTNKKTFSYIKKKKLNQTVLTVINSTSVSMDSTSTTNDEREIAYDYSPFLKIYKDGHVERLRGTDVVPPSVDKESNVWSKDVAYSQEDNTSTSSRLFIPRETKPNQKLPLLVYFHGGGFCIETPFSPTYHNAVSRLVEEANVVALSVDYRRPPEHPLPIGYEDSWNALKWVTSHANGNGNEGWLNNHVDFARVFLGGDSAGGNIAHNIGLKQGGEDKIDGIKIQGIILIHPYFWGKEPIGNEAKEVEKRKTIDNAWMFACPKSSGSDDPWINPIAEPTRLSTLGCTEVLVFVAENDFLRDRGILYGEKLTESGWHGFVEIMEAKEEDHVFHLTKSTCDNAIAMLKRIASFINEA